jgi:hypothetical protein
MDIDDVQVSSALRASTVQVSGPEFPIGLEHPGTELDEPLPSRRRGVHPSIVMRIAPWKSPSGTYVSFGNLSIRFQ